MFYEGEFPADRKSRRQRLMDVAETKVQRLKRPYGVHFGWLMYNACEELLGDDHRSHPFGAWDVWYRRPVFSAYVSDVLYQYKHGFTSVRGKEIRGRLRGFLPYFGFKRMWLRIKLETDDPAATLQEVEEFFWEMQDAYGKWTRGGLGLFVDVVQVEPRLRLVGSA